MQLVNVRDFGATGDAVLGDQSGDRNDAPAFRAAVNAAVLAGHKNVYVPCGNYRLGDGNSTLVGLELFHPTDDGVTIFGDGPCSTLLPAYHGGQVVIMLCAGDAPNCNGPSSHGGPADVTIRDLRIFDDAPIAHGHAHIYVAPVTNLQGGPFIHNETLLFTGGATASFHSLHADQTLWYSDDLEGSPQTGIVTGAISGATANWRNQWGPTAEESHGIAVHSAENFLALRLTIDSIGDEGIDIGPGSLNARVLSSTFLNCPSVPSGGSCAAVSGTTGTEFAFNTYSPGVSGGATSTSKAIAVSNNSPGVDVIDMHIHDEVIIEDSTDPSEIVEVGIALASNVADLHGIVIENSIIEVDNPEGGAIISSGAGNTFDATIRGNPSIIGKIDLHAYGALIDANPSISNPSGDAIWVKGDNIVVSGNAIDGAEGACVATRGTGSFSVIDNDCLDVGGSESPIIGFGSAPDSLTDTHLLVQENRLSVNSTQGLSHETIGCQSVIDSSVIDNEIVGGIDDRASIRNCGIVDGNVLSEIPAIGIDFRSFDNGEASGNSISGGTIAIRIKDSAFALIEDNTCEGQSQACIKMEGSSDGAICQGNQSFAEGGGPGGAPILCDGDGVPDGADNCPGTANPPPFQTDSDGDGVGNWCDNCPLVANSDQADSDGDALGDLCDNCASISNADQTDTDADGTGDLCDNLCVGAATVLNGVSPASQLAGGWIDLDTTGMGPDAQVLIGGIAATLLYQSGGWTAMVPGSLAPGSPAEVVVVNPEGCRSQESVVLTVLPDGDSDGLADGSDNCPAVSNPLQEDADEDGVGDACDNCPATMNADQADADGDEAGDVCDPCVYDRRDDSDGDGFCADVDNCATLANPSQADGDGDLAGDACDNCLGTANTDQADVDGDGVGDVCDVCAFDPDDDSDGDGYCRNLDNCPTLANPLQGDVDADYVGDACDNCPTAVNSFQTDVDADDVGDECDLCPTEPDPLQGDADGDGIGDLCDLVCDDGRDNDGDGLIDFPEDFSCKSPSTPSEYSLGLPVLSSRGTAVLLGLLVGAALWVFRRQDAARA